MQADLIAIDAGDASQALQLFTNASPSSQLVAHYLTASSPAMPRALPRMLVVVDDVFGAHEANDPDWHFALERDSVYDRRERFFPQADLCTPAQLEARVAEPYETVVDLTSCKDARVVAFVRERWDRMPAIVFEPRLGEASGYLDRFFERPAYLAINAAREIAGDGDRVFVRDDVHAGSLLPECSVHLEAMDASGDLALVIGCGPSTFVNSYGNAERVFRAAFERLYGFPMERPRRWLAPAAFTPPRPPALDFTGERYVPWLGGQIRYEHLHRYASVATLCRGRNVLDVACGEGYGTSLLAEGAAHVVGVDIDPESVAHAARTYSSANVRFIASSALALPLDDGSIDVAISFETLEHFVEHDEFFREIKRVLRPEGVFVVSSPNKRVYSDLAEYANPFHVRELYEAELEAIGRAYFKNVRLYGQQIAGVSHLRAMGSAEAEAVLHSEHPLPQPIVPPDPTYFIAVCSDAEIGASIASVFIDGSDFLLTDLENEADVLRKRVRALERATT